VTPAGTVKVCAPFVHANVWVLGWAPADPPNTSVAPASPAPAMSAAQRPGRLIPCTIAR
jgi:hypothetical protein